MTRTPPDEALRCGQFEVVPGSALFKLRTLEAFVLNFRQGGGQNNFMVAHPSLPCCLDSMLADMRF
eukprot:15447441-Alexandrium_andersonii.AAC.1